MFYHETSRAQVLDLLRREDKAERDANDSYSYFDIGNVLTVFGWKNFIHSFGFPPETEEGWERQRWTIRSGMSLTGVF